ncbi:MAG TPA: hypothetical protein V6D28_12665 [Leptolyngbyaceae cyanobacterium]
MTGSSGKTDTWVPNFLIEIHLQISFFVTVGSIATAKTVTSSILYGRQPIGMIIYPLAQICHVRDGRGVGRSVREKGKGN